VRPCLQCAVCPTHSYGDQVVYLTKMILWVEGFACRIGSRSEVRMNNYTIIVE